MTDQEILEHCRNGKIATSGYVLRTVKVDGKPDRTKALHQTEYLPALLRLLEGK